LSPRTQDDYRKMAVKFRSEFGKTPVRFWKDPRSKKKLRKWRDKLSASSARQADYMWSFMSAVFSLAVSDGDLAVNPCAKGGRLYNGSRVDVIWTSPQVGAFLHQRRFAHMHLPDQPFRHPVQSLQVELLGGCVHRPPRSQSSREARPAATPSPAPSSALAQQRPARLPSLDRFRHRSGLARSLRRGVCRRRKLVSPHREQPTGNAFAPGNLGNVGAVLEALRHDPGLLLGRPLLSPTLPGDHLDARIGVAFMPSIKHGIRQGAPPTNSSCQALSQIGQAMTRWGPLTGYDTIACRAEATRPPRETAPVGAVRGSPSRNWTGR
jgi:hypothetical protein